MKNSTSTCVLCGSGDCNVLYSVRDFEYGVPGQWQIAQCSACKFCFQLPLPAPDTVTSFYPRDYSAYSHGSPISWMFHMVYWLDAWRVKRMIGARGRVLDVGCGNGDTMLALQKRGDWDLWGVEFDREAVRAAKAAGLNVKEGDLMTCDLPPGSFDLIRMGHFIEHVLDPMGALRRAFELLRLGGVLFGETPNTDCWDFKLFGRYWGGLAAPRHITLFNHRNLVQALERTGFTQIRITPKLRPVGWSAAIQNLLVDKVGLRIPACGRVRWYLLLVAPCLLLTGLQTLFGWPGTMAFVARKSLVESAKESSTMGEEFLFRPLTRLREEGPGSTDKESTEQE